MVGPKHIGLSDAQTAAVGEVDATLLTEGFMLITAEKEAQFRGSIRYHWRAVLWSMALSVALVMDGFDGAVVSGSSPRNASRTDIKCLRAMLISGYHLSRITLVTRS